MGFTASPSSPSIPAEPEVHNAVLQSRCRLLFAQRRSVALCQSIAKFPMYSETGQMQNPIWTRNNDATQNLTCHATNSRFHCQRPRHIVGFACACGPLCSIANTNWKVASWVRAPPCSEAQPSCRHSPRTLSPPGAATQGGRHNVRRGQRSSPRFCASSSRSLHSTRLGRVVAPAPPAARAPSLDPLES